MYVNIFWKTLKLKINGALSSQMSFETFIYDYDHIKIIQVTS